MSEGGEKLRGSTRQGSGVSWLPEEGPNASTFYHEEVQKAPSFSTASDGGSEERKGVSSPLPSERQPSPPQPGASSEKTDGGGPAPDPGPPSQGPGEGPPPSIQKVGTPPGTMRNLLRDATQEYRSPQRGDVLDGVVVTVDKDGILVDIGTKSEGIVPSSDLQRLSPTEAGNIKVGDEVVVFVVQPEDQDGHVVLSLNQARSEKGWRTLQKRYDEGSIFDAEVVDHNKGGLIVNAEGLRGFVPMSQVAGLRYDNRGTTEVGEKLAAMVGQRIPLKVLEINRRRNRLILSERAAVQEKRQRRKDELLSELKEGETRRGIVSSLCEFGAFIDLGGADGLAHISELAWGAVAHPSDVLKVGQEVDVRVLQVDKEKKKIALSLKRAQPDPWKKVADKYRVGDLVVGTVTKLASFGAFVRIEEGVEGLVHVSELAEGHVLHPRNVVAEGNVLTLRIIRMEPERGRLGLSLRKVESDKVEPDKGQETTPGQGEIKGRKDTGSERGTLSKAPGG